MPFSHIIAPTCTLLRQPGLGVAAAVSVDLFRLVDRWRYTRNKSIAQKCSIQQYLDLTIP